jgi:hypothetical protein
VRSFLDSFRQRILVSLRAYAARYKSGCGHSWSRVIAVSDGSKNQHDDLSSERHDAECSLPSSAVAVIEPTALVIPLTTTLRKADTMSIFTDIESGVPKFVNFFISVFTKTSAVISVLEKLTPTTLSAMLAIFYDVTSFIADGGSIVAAIKTGNFANVFSTTTLGLISKFEADLKAGEAVIVADVKALGVAIETPAPAAVEIPTPTVVGA